MDIYTYKKNSHLITFLPALCLMRWKFLQQFIGKEHQFTPKLLKNFQGNVAYTFGDNVILVTVYTKFYIALWNWGRMDLWERWLLTWFDKDKMNLSVSLVQSNPKCDNSFLAEAVTSSNDKVLSICIWWEAVCSSNNKLLSIYMQ